MIRPKKGWLHPDASSPGLGVSLSRGAARFRVKS